MTCWLAHNVHSLYDRQVMLEDYECWLGIRGGATHGKSPTIRIVLERTCNAHTGCPRTTRENRTPTMHCDVQAIRQTMSETGYDRPDCVPNTRWQDATRSLLSPLPSRALLEAPCISTVARRDDKSQRRPRRPTMQRENTFGRTLQELGHITEWPLPDAWRQVLRRRRLTDIQARLVLALLAIPHDAKAN